MTHVHPVEGLLYMAVGTMFLWNAHPLAVATLMTAMLARQIVRRVAK